MEKKFFSQNANPKNNYLTGKSSETSSPVNDHETSFSDSGSNISSSSETTHRRREIFPEKLAVNLDENDRAYDLIHHRFITCLGVTGEKTTVTSIHRRNWSELSSQAKLRSFFVHSRASEIKHGGSGNVKFGWYGDEKEKIERIVSHGFNHLDIQNNQNGAVFLSPDYSPSNCLEGAVADEQGIRHVLLCRVILGRSELVQSGSSQIYPSSNEFDSGVDNFSLPKKYVIWSTDMNSHILPEYIVSFKISGVDHLSTKDDSRKENGVTIRRPKSPWCSFPELISVLSKFMPKSSMSVINKHHKDFKDKKITRKEIIQKIRQIAGDDMLITVIKLCRGANSKEQM